MANMMKMGEITIRKHFWLWAQKWFETTESGSLVIKSIPMMTKKDYQHINNRNPDGLTVKVEMYWPTKIRLYALEKYIIESFYMEMHLYASAYKSAGKTMRKGIKAFLEKYEIGEDVYSIDTAYRMYHKRKKRWP